MNTSEIKVLVVDDEAQIRKVIRLLLEKKGYNVIEASNGEAAVESVAGGGVDLVIMDVMMPKVSGIEATSKIRELSTLPILFLTAKSLDRDREAAYVAGGDDYLVKPFSAVELMLKVDSLLRRYHVYKGKAPDANLVELPCGVTLDVEKRQVFKNNTRVELRDREQDILFYLYENRGSIMDTSSIYESVWGEAALHSGSNNVMVNMLNLRKKLEDDPSSPRIIKTVWGRGYLIEG